MDQLRTLAPQWDDFEVRRQGPMNCSGSSNFIPAVTTLFHRHTGTPFSQLIGTPSPGTTKFTFPLESSFAMAQVYGQVARVETSGEQSVYSFSDMCSAYCWCRSSRPNHGCSLGESRVCTITRF
jgi:hypothetical protein